MLLKKDNHGRTPIALAIGSHADNSVIQYLLRRCPKSAEIPDRLMNLPLHIACSGDLDKDKTVAVQALVP